MSGIIVVGVDGSETAERAAAAAGRMAAALDASLHVVTAFGADRLEVLGSGSDQIVVSDSDYAEKIAARVAADIALRQDGLDIVPASVRGRPADAIIRYASEAGAQLIVVGNRRMQGLGRVLGSVANSVAHSAPCDVLIVKTDD